MQPIKLAALGAAKVTPEQAAKILHGIGTAARVVEVSEVIQRIARLEDILADQNSP